MEKGATKKNNKSIWAVRGVSHEAQNAAKIAAKKAGESLGHWLSRRVLEVAQRELKGEKQEIARQEDMLNILENLSNRLDTELLDIRNQLKEVGNKKKSWLDTVFKKSS